MEKRLKIAWVAGIVYLVFGIPEMILEIVREEGVFSAPFVASYVAISIVNIAVTIFFMRGFILIGERLKNHILTISAYVVILTAVVVYSYDVISLSYDAWERDAVRIAAAILVGFVGIFYGIGILRLESRFGSAAKLAGVLEIIAGVTFVFVITFFIGLVLLIPATICEIVILYKAAENVERYLQEPGASVSKG